MVRGKMMRVDNMFYLVTKNLKRDVNKQLGINISEPKATRIIANMVIGKSLVIKKERKNRWSVE